tara:strand:+ start:52371 stop:53138 length:768 start_codon:yes stop_codon:yes gene_type:complete
MSSFDFYKNKKVKEKKPITFRRLNRLYNKIPNTKGCMENINKKGGCNAWCCRLQNPQVLYSEFLNTWDNVLKQFSMNDMVLIVERAIRSYVTSSVIKGCIFFDEDDNLCAVHETRPFNCRTYGIIPKKEFTARYEKLKEVYKDNPDADVRDQCDLVSTLNGRKVKSKEIDKWWRLLNNVEANLGIPRENINDDLGGSYRTFHDHILLEIMPNDVMEELQKVRLMENEEEKEQAVHAFMKEFKERIDGKTNEGKGT